MNLNKFLLFEHTVWFLILLMAKVGHDKIYLRKKAHIKSGKKNSHVAYHSPG